MFYYICGDLAVLDPAYAVIDAGGVGYKLTITQTTYSSLPHRAGAETLPPVKLYTYLAVREDDVELFGFGSTEELDAFKLLITVSGIGPKAAVSILSQMTPDKLFYAICSEDKRSISQANGIGPKTAARIVLELKDKVKKAYLMPEGGLSAQEEPVPLSTDNSKLSDAQNALMTLGYSRNEAYSVLRSIDTDHLELDDIIRLALKKMMK